MCPEVERRVRREALEASGKPEASPADPARAMAAAQGLGEVLARALVRALAAALALAVVQAPVQALAVEGEWVVVLAAAQEGAAVPGALNLQENG